MSVSVIPSSAVAQIEKTLLSELDSVSSVVPTSSTPSTGTAATQLTKDLAALLKDLASGNVDESKTTIAKVQQDIQAQSASDSSSPLDNLLARISSSLNSTNSTSASLQDLDTYFLQNGPATGNVINTTA
jgi:hypothetical protein